MNIISTNSVVSMRYIMKDSSGQVLETTMEGAPVSYLHGAPGIAGVLQEQLEGLKTGDRKKVSLPASPGLAADVIFEVIVDEVRAATGEEVLQGYPAKKVSRCGDDCNC